MTAVKTLSVSRLLYRRYPGQTSPQGCYVELDCRTGELSAATNAELGSAVPSAVWHGHCVRWPILPLKALAAERLLQELAPLAQRVVDGYECVWDGSNHVAHRTHDAREAIQEITGVCGARSEDEESCLRVWDAGDWLHAIGSRADQRQVLGVTAATTDAELEALAESLKGDAAAEGVDVLEGVQRYLEGLRKDALADLIDAVADEAAYEDDGDVAPFVRARLAAGAAPDVATLASAYDAWCAAGMPQHG